MDDFARTLTLTWGSLGGGGPTVSLIDLLEEVGVTVPPTPGIIPTSPAYSNTVAAIGVKGLPPALGRHILLDELGAGGMGRVLEARDPDLRRTVAVKVVANPARVTQHQLARFVAEAQITSQLEHPNIVPVHDVGITEQGHFYFVMKKVVGRSLREVVKGLRAGDAEDIEHFTLRRLLAMFVQVCNAMAYAHDRGVLHRDLKPDNVMVGKFGEVLVMDWGVARVIGDHSEDPSEQEAIERMSLPPTLDGIAVGTPGYMSPEQATGDLPALDARSDIWSLGAILYELVTWERAFVGSNLYHLILQSSLSRPEDPRSRAPERRVPDRIAEIVMRALSQSKDARFASALELGAAVEEFLEGSARRTAADRHLRQARKAWDTHQQLAEERAVLLRQEKELKDSIPRWAPIEEKIPLLEVRDGLRGIAPARATAFGDVLGHCEKALSQDPNNADARAFLADVFLHYFLESEGTADAAHFLARVRQYDDAGRHDAILAGGGSITLRTDPDGAQVVAREVIRDGLVWRTGPPVGLGTTPLVDHPLGHGSWFLTLSAPGKRDTIYPVFLERCAHWDCGEPVPLYTDSQIGEGWVYVPHGPTIVGGDPVAVDGLPRGVAQVDGFFASVYPVTNAEYCAFLNGLHSEEPGSADQRCPRKESYVDQGAVTRLRGGSLYWTPPSPTDRWVVPERDEDGDAWGEDWPVFSITWDDAKTYCAWRCREEGLPVGTIRLPFEPEWSKLARGVDGRFFPWGDDFDPALCKMRHSREARPVPEPVGTFPTDVSVYGARDLAGGIRELCAEDTFDGDPDRRPARAGSWRASEVPCRAAYRYGQVWWQVFTSVGFRTVRGAPLADDGASP